MEQCGSVAQCGTAWRNSGKVWWNSGTGEQCGTIWWESGTVWQCGTVWWSSVEQNGGTGNSMVEQCDGTMWNSVAVWHSVVEQCGTAWRNSGTVW